MPGVSFARRHAGPWIRCSKAGFFSFVQLCNALAWLPDNRTTTQVQQAQPRGKRRRRRRRRRARRLPTRRRVKTKTLRRRAKKRRKTVFRPITKLTARGSASRHKQHLAVSIGSKAALRLSQRTRRRASPRWTARSRMMPWGSSAWRRRI